MDAKLFVKLFNQTKPLLTIPEIADKMKPPVDQRTPYKWLKKKKIRLMIDEDRKLIENRVLWKGFESEDVRKQELYLDRVRGKVVEKTEQKLEANVKTSVNLDEFIKAKANVEKPK